MKNKKYINRILETFDDWSDMDKEIIADGFVLLDLHREIDMFTEILGSSYDISTKQIEILELLYSHPENQLTPAELADEVHLTRSTMTGNLDSLEKKGFISRESHPSDRRMTLIRMTEEGVKFCENTMPQRYSDILRVMKVLTPEEKNGMKEIYTKLLHLLKEIAMEESN